MFDGLGLIGLLALLFGGGKRPSAARGGGGSRPAPQLPAGSIPADTQPLPPPPWPCVVPSGLPAFPGRGWEYDEPPPISVQQRAGQIVSKLWARGSGACQIEQTAGRWIAYRAEVVRSGKHGVVAYRLAAKALPAAPSSPRSPAPRSPAPSSPAPSSAAPPVVFTSVSPGLPQRPQPQAGSTRVPMPGGSVDVKSPLSLPTLRKGMGLRPAAPVPDVVLLQQKLGIDDDGRFGSGTFAAVQLYQRRNGLQPDGIVGPNTWSSLFAVRA